MASRYGRKKRRQHLEAIEALTDKLQQNLQQSIRAEQRAAAAIEERALLLARLKRWNAHLRDMLGRHTALASDPLPMDPGMPLDQVRRVAIDPPLMLPIETGDETVSLEAVSLMVGAEDLIQIVGGLGPIEMSEMRRMVHMTLVHGDEPYIVRGKRFDWNYAISEKALRNGLSEHQIIHIAEQIAMKFHERLVEELGVRRAA